MTTEAPEGKDRTAPRRAPRRAALGLAAWGALAGGPAAAQGWNLYEGGRSVFVPFHNAGSNQDLEASPSLALSFPGFTPAIAAFTMDTGSTGIIASPDNFQPGPGAVAVEPGTLTYSSSGRRNHGTWWRSQVEIRGPDGEVMAVAQVPVLQVTRITCLPRARDCEPSESPTRVAMMGVGFAREADHQPQGTPDRNPLINLRRLRVEGRLQELPAAWHAGYAVSRDGVALGLSPERTEGAAFVKLLPDPALPGEWQAPPGELAIGGVAGQGSALVDTGVSSMFLQPPPGTPLAPAQPVPEGTTIGLTLPGGGAAFLRYGFTLRHGPGDRLARDTPLTPARVTVAHGNAVFVNTGRFFLNAFEVIFDPANGFVGYRPARGSAAGQVVPGLALRGPVTLPDGFRSSLPVTLLDETRLASSGHVELGGGVSGPGRLVLAGGGTFRLSGEARHAGGTVLESGTRLSPGR
ncbi:hypothetical protein [Roseococcus sp. SYP-B2431]|uniref:hypothetical protein n=1 Tax=Roseococcus sp. SYP-B2431 TaxID=2496640 RepID=UPI0013F42178|nr:hypothetical protein [Roseococcus sp. SYP-B2431]